MASNHLGYTNVRREEREEVHYRTVATTAAGQPLELLVVNISPGGLMARCDETVEPGASVTFTLPGLTKLAAEVRWALGGRIGCEFAIPIAPHHYFSILPRLRG